MARKDDIPRTGERIAKVLARAGVASRREAERLIAEGRVTVNGRQIERAALNVVPADRIAVDGREIGAPEPVRLWLYHKPTGLVSTTKDEQGRPTVFDDLPEDMPRVMSVGRLDLNSEGLLLLTNDGAVKRKLELPSTGWTRRYRVRVNGRPDDARLDPLRRGLEIDGERFQPMTVRLDRQQGANAWLTIGLREGKNREIRRAMEAVGLSVNRLIRVAYGPFQLGELKPGAVEEVKPRIVRDQLGLADAEAETAPKRQRLRPAAKKGAPGDRPGSARKGRPAPKEGAPPGKARATGPAAKGKAAPGRPRQDASSGPEKPRTGQRSGRGTPTGPRGGRPRGGGRGT
ncbi:MAG: pseudouridine synthase [Rhodosalinus sp.]